jgi:hypothetical protein
MADAGAPIRQITKDHLYDAVAPTDFGAMLDIDRHMTRSSAFDKIISATHDHFWDPLDKKYIDFEDDFRADETDFVPDYLVPALSTDYVTNHFADKPADRIRFKSQVARWVMSSILHGEQGALNLSASLSRRARIRRQSNARRRPSRHGVREIYPRALGLAFALRACAG